MAMIDFQKDEKEQLVALLQRYMHDELDMDVGQFDAEFFLDFISEKMGGYFYNRGVCDAQVVLESKVLEISDNLYDIQKSTEFVR